MRGFEFTVRSAEQRDIDAVLGLKLALQTEEGSQHTLTASREQLSASMFGPQPYFEALLAYRGTAAVGMLIFNLKHYAGWPAPAISLQDMFVEPRFRRLGVGLLLLRRLAIEAHQRQVVHIELVARADNQARSFYQHAGFFEVEEAATYVAGGAEIAALANEQG